MAKLPKRKEAYRRVTKVRTDTAKGPLRQKRQTVAEVVERAKLEIIADVENGTHPALVRCFDDLHDFADANAYGGGNDECVNSRFWKRVHEQLDAWIKTGVLGRCMSEPERALRAQRALECYKADLGEHGPVDSATLRDLLHDTLHWLAQQNPPNEYPDPGETLMDAANAALVDFPEGREYHAALEAMAEAIIDPKRKSKTKRTLKL
jgi:hypothetical protein